MDRTASIIGLVLGLIVVSYVAVPGLGAVFQDSESVVEYTEGSPEGVNPAISGEVTNVNGTTDEVTLELSNQNSTEVITLTGTGDNGTVTLPDGDVDVTLDEVGGDTATITHTYDAQFGWSSGAAALVVALVLFVIIGMALVFAAPVLDTL